MLQSMGLQRVRHDLATEQQHHKSIAWMVLSSAHLSRLGVPGGKEPVTDEQTTLVSSHLSSHSVPQKACPGAADCL